MWLIVCCFQRKQTSRTLDGLVLEGEELDFPKILCCWNRKWKNPQLHLFFIHGSRPSLGDAAAWIIYSHIIPHSLVKLYYQNPLFLLCPPPAPPPPSSWCLTLNFMGLLLRHSTAHFEPVSDFCLLASSAPASSPLSCLKHPNELCIHVGILKKSVYLLYARLSPHH